VPLDARSEREILSMCFLCGNDVFASFMKGEIIIAIAIIHIIMIITKIIIIVL
jgi:hypothetical protein